MDTEAWIHYFESNRGSFTEPEWENPHPFDEGDSLDALRRSLATFQLGETGEGGTLQRYARKLAGREGYRRYDRALRLFVDEEKEHARLLALTLGYLGGGLIRRQWSNSVFRNLRRLINLEFEIQIFVTAEIIGKAYYALLRHHVDDPVLRSVCGKLIGDEVKHLNFHIEFFRRRLAGVGPAKRAAWKLQFIAIFHAARLAVWLDHRRCLKAFGADRAGFMCRTSRGLRSLMANLDSGKSLLPTVLSASPGAAR